MRELTPEEERRLHAALGGARTVPAHGDPQAMDEHTLLLKRIRDCLKRWASRYAGSDHAKRHVIETAGIIQEIDAYLEQK
jgi:hypothetical protein